MVCSSLLWVITVFTDSLALYFPNTLGLLFRLSLGWGRLEILSSVSSVYSSLLGTNETKTKRMLQVCLRTHSEPIVSHFCTTVGDGLTSSLRSSTQFSTANRWANYRGALITCCGKVVRAIVDSRALQMRPMQLLDLIPVLGSVLASDLYSLVFIFSSNPLILFYSLFSFVSPPGGLCSFV